uniref:5-hydroxyisourate hydrolase n=1 Tax=Solibacter usitatus (strain Ellin6076) TaxID=234267 RepID=Q02C44_SOLUE
MARLSTHVLDTARGQAAANMRVELYRFESGERVHCLTMRTNADGRTDSPLLSGDRIATGHYEIAFAAGDYFRALGVPVTDPPFLDEIVVRFGIADSTANYHVPLLVSPYGYSTYKGT